MTAAAFAQPQPVGEPMALRDAFGGRPPGEVEHLAHPAGQREDEFQAVHQVRQAAGVGQCVPAVDRAARHRFDLGDQPQPGHGVRGLDAGPVLVVLDPGGPEARRPVAPGRRVTAAGVQAMASQAGPAEPPRPGLGQQRARPGRGQQRGGVAGLEPGGGHRPGPHGRQCSWPGEQDQPGPACCTRLRDQHGPRNFRHSLPRQGSAVGADLGSGTCGRGRRRGRGYGGPAGGEEQPSGDDRQRHDEDAVDPEHRRQTRS